jgi:glutathione synthase/RimK-type ligase-like ATP-grasp enzyme
MILILTSATDTHADRMEDVLQSRGARYLRFDPARFPQEATLSVRLGANGVHRSLEVDDTVHDLDDVGAVWVRRPGRPQPSPALDPNAAEVVAGECAMYVADVWETLDVVQLPANRPVIQRAQHKVRQLQLALELGFEIPDTAVGNEPRDLITMFNEHPEVITKQAGLTLLGAAPGTEDAVARFTQPVRARDLLHAESLRLCPVIVQGYVPKSVELRVTVIGERVFTAAIHSQQTRHTRHDWRHYDQNNTLISAYELPAPVAARCCELLKRLGLRYGAIDLIVTPDGRYVFVEINPSGQYLWIELETGLPITGAIADVLCEADRRHQQRRAAMRAHAPLEELSA